MPSSVAYSDSRDVYRGYNEPVRLSAALGSTTKGILIGIMSAFAAAFFGAFILAIVYFFRYTPRGRILLDRLGRPGEYDDEQAFAKEEAEALEQMDDLQRTEYLRAKGMDCASRVRLRTDGI
jgi:hypothetical protein